MDTKFYNQDGSLTAYALACGHIQSETVLDGRFDVRLRLSADGCYHVKVRDRDLEMGLAAWETYDTLTEARKGVRQARAYFKRLPADAPALLRDTSPNARPVWAS